MAEKKKQAPRRKPFEFGEKEKNQVTSVIDGWNKSLAENKELPTDVLICALGNFVANIAANVAYVNKRKGDEYYYLLSTVDFAFNALRQAGIDIDKQYADYNKQQAEFMKKHPVKMGEA